MSELTRFIGAPRVYLSLPGDNGCKPRPREAKVSNLETLGTLDSVWGVKFAKHALAPHEKLAVSGERG